MLISHISVLCHSSIRFPLGFVFVLIALHVSKGGVALSFIFVLSWFCVCFFVAVSVGVFQDLGFSVLGGFFFSSQKNSHFPPDFGGKICNHEFLKLCLYLHTRPLLPLAILSCRDSLFEPHILFCCGNPLLLRLWQLPASLNR